jgi:hypothetical protein
VVAKDAAEEPAPAEVSDSVEALGADEGSNGGEGGNDAEDEN